MKKILSYILGIGLLITACDPMDEIYDDLDKIENPYTENVELTLTDADYESVGADNYYFDDANPAADLIPGILSEKYPALEYGSSALVTYNFGMGYPDLSDYSGATYYNLTDADYNSASQVVGVAQYFSPENPADDYIPAILSASIPDAVDGDIYIISHMYSDVEPDVSAPEEIIAFEYEFESSLGDFTTVNVLGDQDWYSSGYQGQGYAKMSGYSGGAQPNEDWLISPAIDLTGLTGCVLIVNQAINYIGDQWDQVAILVSTDYDSGDPNTATWTEVDVPNLPAGNNWDFVESGNIDVSAFDGQVVKVAFKYISSDSNASTWEVNKVTVKGMGVGTKSGIIVDPIKIEELYTYDSGWDKTEGAYYVKVADYNAMGAPGKYDNFSSSDNPDNYLPQLLAQKFPYAQEGDVMVAVYKYYSGGVQTRADEYHFMSGSWVEYDPIVVNTDQFLLTRSDGWVFDPTVIFTMSSSDYQTIVDWVKANKGSSYIDSYGTAEFYYGAGSYYSNFDLRDGKWDSSVFATWQDAVKESIGEVLLPIKYPNAVAQVSGIDVFYKVSFDTYDGGYAHYTYVFQCTKSGPDPEFTFVSEE